MSIVSVEWRASEVLDFQARGFRFCPKLGQGSCAKVYLTKYREGQPDECTLACKQINTSTAAKIYVKKFLPRELEITLKVVHPHIIHIHSVYQRREKIYMFMRFAENGDLLDFIIKKGPISEAQARVWFRQLALAIQYLHTMNIVHRDLKCENALITCNYNLKLVDFGFARYMTDNSQKDVLSDTFCGSLSYVAPEIIRGRPYKPKQVDMWSLGVILFIMINRIMPFDDSNVKKLLLSQMARSYKYREKLEESLSPEVKDLISHLLEPVVEQRWVIEAALQSPFVAADPKLLKLSPAEQTALNFAKEARVKKEAPVKAQKKGQLVVYKNPASEENNDPLRSISFEQIELAKGSGSSVKI